MIINVRGTSGSGKSTLVRKVMEHYASKTPVLSTEVPGLLELEDRSRPVGYLLRDPGALFVPGHYETACGGCDTIAKRQFDNVYHLVRWGYVGGFDVLFEGLLLSAENARLIQLHQEGIQVRVVGLTTPMEECLAGIRDRRKRKGGSKAMEPFAESVFKNAASKEKGTESCLRKMEAAGVMVHRLSREDALRYVCQQLRLP